jgi:hypothetical protein
MGMLIFRLSVTFMCCKWMLHTEWPERVHLSAGPSARRSTKRKAEADPEEYDEEEEEEEDEEE